MPSKERRKKLHWKRVQERHKKEKEQLESILPETVEGQVIRAWAPALEDDYVKVPRVQTSPAHHACIIC